MNGSGLGAAGSQDGKFPAVVSSASSLDSLQAKTVVTPFLENANTESAPPVPHETLSSAPPIASVYPSTAVPTPTTAATGMISTEQGTPQQVPYHPGAAFASGGTAAAAPTFQAPMLAVPPGVASATTAASLPHNNTVPEFLFQLTKMLTDDNRECIEWSKGRIEVHNPPKLASDVLHKYFRHSKYASFQRQLNYFGFRKLAGKGKMAPCSYINEAVTEDLRSLLTIKRKTGATKEKGNNQSNSNASSSPAMPKVVTTTAADPVLAGIAAGMYGSNKRMRFDSTGEAPAFKVAIGKGVKHQMNGYLKGTTDAVASPAIAAPAPVSSSVYGVASNGSDVPNSTPPTAPPSSSVPLTFLDPPQLGMDITASLNELKNNYENTLQAVAASEDSSGTEQKNGGDRRPSLFGAGGMLSRDSSLVDLAMLPTLEETCEPTLDTGVGSELAGVSSGAMNFVDFPHTEVNPATTAKEGSQNQGATDLAQANQK